MVEGREPTTRCNILRITVKREIDIYLETSSNTVS